MRQRFETRPIPDPIEGVELAQQFQQYGLGAGRIGGCGADPARQHIGLPPLLLGGYRLRCWPVVDRDRLTRVAAWYHPWTIMNILDQLLILPREIPIR